MRLIQILLCCFSLGWANLSIAAGDTRATLYSYQVIEQLPHSRAVFTQGLEWQQQEFYVSGGGYGESLIYRRPESHHQQREVRILPNDIFAEGLTLWQDRLYLLSWRAKKIFVFDRETLQPTATHQWPREGWGLCHNQHQLILSDGSDQLFFLNPDTLAVEKTLKVRLNGQPLSQLNELEWVDGKIFANVWKQDWIVMIDPDSGDVVGKLDLSGLLPDEQRRRSTDVLNGIAYDKEGKRLWVTGKRWPTIYQIEWQAQTAAE